MFTRGPFNLFIHSEAWTFLARTEFETNKQVLWACQVDRVLEVLNDIRCSLRVK